MSVWFVGTTWWLLLRVALLPHWVADMFVEAVVQDRLPRPQSLHPRGAGGMHALAVIS